MIRRPLALLLVTLAGCGDLAAGIELRADMHGTDFADTDRVELTDARLTITSLELVRCESAVARLWELVLPSASAHVDATPTRLGTPQILDASSPEVVEMGVFTPPAGRYCALSVLVTPADADTREVDDRTLGKTLSVAGRLDGAAFDPSTALSYDRTFALSPPLDTATAAGLLLTVDPNPWFEEPDALDGSDPYLLSQSLLVAAFDSIEVTVVPMGAP
jgi:hypothetical protein